ncbi:MAG: hypothetical protein EPO21_09205 [Chloroflexota bacterium]|nr:MAG: hypothetical protein EPO21_09205 [Chloroflexota bacterium]
MPGELTADSTRKVVTAMLWMTILSVMAFWLPIVGPLIAGFVGGRMLRRVDLALIAALLPALVAALLALFGWHYVPYPLAGALAGGDPLRAILFDSLPLLIGAVLGAVLP